MINKLRLLFVTSVIMFGLVSFNAMAGNTITIDEVMYDEAYVVNGVYGGTAEWNANGVLTLDNFDGGSIRGDGDLEIIVKGKNRITCSQGEIYGLSTRLGNLHIKGDGKLTVEATEKSKWSSAIYIVVDSEDKEISIDGVEIVANSAFCGIEAHVEDYDRDGITKSATLNINNASLSLSGAKAIFICGDNANVIMNNAKIKEPANAHVVDFYFNDIKTAKVFSDKNEDMRLLESEYDANNNIDDLKVFLTENGMLSSIVIEKQPFNILMVILKSFLFALICLIVYRKVKKDKEKKSQNSV